MGRSLPFIPIIGISATSVAAGVSTIAARVDGAGVATLVAASVSSTTLATALVLAPLAVGRGVGGEVLIVLHIVGESSDGGGDLLDAGVLGELLAGVDTYGGGEGDGQHVGGQHRLGGYGGVTVLLGVGLHVLVADATADLGVDGDELLTLLVGQLDAHGLRALLVDELHEGSQDALCLVAAHTGSGLDETGNLDGVQFVDDHALGVPAMAHVLLVLVWSKLLLTVLDCCHSFKGLDG